tara:strand:- start:1019 stop:1432 length:414 start_codon:yes stop_codon:yes gene_type:complete
MHELTLARSLIDLVNEYASQHQEKNVIQINIRLGERSAMARALYFCFESVARGTACEGAILNIEEIPLTVYCNSCNDVKKPSGPYNFRCPDCGLPTPKVVNGKEMELVSIELNQSKPEKPINFSSSSKLKPHIVEVR